MDKVSYWQKRVLYYRHKYGKDSIEVKSAKLNLKNAKEGGVKNG